MNGMAGKGVGSHQKPVMMVCHPTKFKLWVFQTDNMSANPMTVSHKLSQNEA
jgi:hypothetical protein